MAQAAQTAALLDELLVDITRLSRQVDARKLRQHLDASLKILKSAQYWRVNQFEVSNVLDGLVEKFLVLNRDDLSSALSDNLRALKNHADKWTPDVLFLLLALSDQPVKKSPDYVRNTRASSPDQPNLTWDDLLKDDPVSDEELWQEPAYSPFSTDSEDDPVPALEADKDRRSARLPSKDVKSTAASLFVAVNASLLDNRRAFSIGSAPRDTNQSITVNETQVVREVLLALRSLRTSMFDVDDSGSYGYYRSCKLEDTSSSAFDNVMRNITTAATTVNCVRRWSSRACEDPLLQAFTASVQEQLRSMDQSLASIEEAFVGGDSARPVTLLDVLERARCCTRPMAILRKVITQSSPDHNGFIYLELLHTAISDQQAVGQDDISHFLLKVFIDCLRVFLRPIQTWMLEGRINSIDSSFFVMELPGPVDKACLWRDRFHLRSVSQKGMVAPQFLETSAQRILNAGKSIAFLTELGFTQQKAAAAKSMPAVDDFLDETGRIQEVPFGLLFSRNLNNWIDSMHGPATAILAQRLLNEHKLKRCLLALQEIYLCSDGTRLQALMDPLIASAGTRRSSWKDSYLLSEHARAVFAQSLNVDSRLIRARAISAKSSGVQMAAETTVVIEYQLPWPIMNIIQPASRKVYADVLTLLEQLYRAKYHLRTISFTRTTARDQMAVGLRNKLLRVVDIVNAHFFQAVIQPRCAELMTKIVKAQDVDAMIEEHERFVHDMLNQCLLSKNLSPIHRALIAILHIVERLAQVSQTRDTSAGRAQTREQSHHGSQFLSMHNSRRRKDIEILESDTDDESSGDAYEADSEAQHTVVSQVTTRLDVMEEELDKSLALMITGLRAISRAGGESTWEMLADKLDWKSSRSQNSFAP